MIDLLWNIRQHYGIQDAQTSATDARQAARDAGNRVEQLEADVDRLLLICRALWELHREAHQKPDDALLQKIYEIDMRDGKADAKMSRPQVRTCSQCGRTLNRRHIQCMYCGTQQVPRDFFETVR